MQLGNVDGINCVITAKKENKIATKKKSENAKRLNNGF